MNSYGDGFSEDSLSSVFAFLRWEWIFLLLEFLVLILIQFFTLDFPSILICL